VMSDSDWLIASSTPTQNGINKRERHGQTCGHMLADAIPS